MTRCSWRVIACVVAMAFSGLQASAQTTQDPAMNASDQLSWQFFIAVNTSAGGNNATFETWASDTDTFKVDPQFPMGPTPSILHPPVVATAGRSILQRLGRKFPAIAPGPASPRRETRRNRAAFDFIVQNNLYNISGLRGRLWQTAFLPSRRDRNQGQLGCSVSGFVPEALSCEYRS